jgi:predicted secreted Zn-dependent protease
MIAKRNNPASKTYSVSGKTLAEIHKDILKKGPVDPNEGKRFAGSCLGTISIDVTDKDFTYEITPESSPVEVTAKITGGTLTSSPVITTPKLASDKGLSDTAKKEWKRFIGATQVHEDGHAASLYKLTVKVTQDIVNMSATETGADEKAAKASAKTALWGKVSAVYGGTKFNDLVNADIKAYDAETNHGATQGAVLKTSIT